MRATVLLLALLASSRLAAQVTSGPPWIELGLRDNQKLAINEIIAAGSRRLAEEERRVEQLIDASDPRDKTGQVLALEAALQRNRIVREIRQQQRAELERVLDPEQRTRLRALGDRIVSEASLYQFAHYRASQEYRLWCWAAGIQMLLRYSGLRISQSEIVARAKGTSVPEAASDADIEKAVEKFVVSGIHGHADWRIGCTATPLRPSIVNSLNDNRFLLGALNQRHLVVLHTIRYFDAISGFRPDSVIAFDPLKGTDFTASWEDAARSLSTVWTCDASIQPVRIDIVEGDLP